MAISTLLIVILVVLLIGAVPSWPHARSWGYGPSGLLGVGASDRRGACTHGSLLIGKRRHVGRHQGYPYYLIRDRLSASDLHAVSRRR